MRRTLPSVCITTEMLYRTNLLALTGHAHSPTYPPNKVMIYDDHLQRPIGELIFRQVRSENAQTFLRS